MTMTRLGLSCGLSYFVQYVNMTKTIISLHLTANDQDKSNIIYFKQKKYKDTFTIQAAIMARRVVYFTEAWGRRDAELSSANCIHCMLSWRVVMHSRH
jgi:hypothetical protein